MNTPRANRNPILIALLTLAAGAHSLSCGGSDETSDAARCERVREHLVDVETSGQSASLRQRHRETLLRALGDEFVTHCAREMSDEQHGRDPWI